MDKMAGSYRNFNRNILVNAMEIIEINAINFETLQASLAGSPYVLGLPVNFHPITFHNLHPAFCGQLNFLSHPSLQCLHVHQHFIYQHN